VSRAAATPFWRDPITSTSAAEQQRQQLHLVAEPQGRRRTQRLPGRLPFFYDLLHLPDGRSTRLKVRSMVSLLPLAVATVFPPDTAARFPGLLTGATDFIARHPSVSAMVTPGQSRGRHGHYLLSFLDEPRLRRVLAHMLDEAEFFSPYGIRSMSRYHADHPFSMDAGGQQYRVSYLPAESDSGMFGGNSNWRGPIWFPLNALMIRALLTCTRITATTSWSNVPPDRVSGAPATGPAGRASPRCSPSCSPISPGTNCSSTDSRTPCARTFTR
jgi:hypothetical protein